MSRLPKIAALVALLGAPISLAAVAAPGPAVAPASGAS